MKKLFFAIGAIMLASAQIASAQATFTTEFDSTSIQIHTSETAARPDKITAVVDSVIIDWIVVASDFPTDWSTDRALGICDNFSCRINFNGLLWNGTTGTKQSSDYYRIGTPGDFHILFTPDSTTTYGVHYMTINLKDAKSGYNKNITFTINYSAATGIPTITASEHITLYPNPAHDQINILVTAPYKSTKAVIYDVAGKKLVTQGVNAGRSAIDITSIPQGIYIMQLLDEQNQVIENQAFTRK